MSGRPLAIIEVARANIYCAVWFFDEQLRRVLQVDCRRLAKNRLFVVGGRQWAYTEAAHAEFEDHITWGEYHNVPGAPAGGGAIHRGNKNPDIEFSLVQREDPWLDAPEFGDWSRLIRAFPGHLAALECEVSPTVDLDDVSDPTGEGLPAGMRPWHPPRPLRPGRLDLLFTPGTRLEVGSSEAIPGVGGTVTVEVGQIGTLRMPSGALIACDPGYLYEPPGERVVETYEYRQATSRSPRPSGQVNTRSCCRNSAG